MALFSLRIVKRNKIAFLISNVLVLYFVYKSYTFFQLTMEYYNDLKQVKVILKDSQTKTILFWNSFFGNKTFNFPYNSLINCPMKKKCIFTFNRNLMNEEEFDAVVFHGIDNFENDNVLPKKRSIFQRYVFVSLESPAYRNVLKLFSESYFNLTMTYNFKSDIFFPYSYIVDKRNQLIVAPSLTVKWDTSYEADEKVDENLEKMVKGKKRMAIWFRSNCYSIGGRQYYVNDLEKYMSVDKIGNCQTTDEKCPQTRDCFADIVEPNYFFYLSFENSLCNYYVTEKFFNALQHNVVPVVYGGANYSNFGPPHSYINALDFDSPKELAKYLISLTKNHTEYMKYFRWKKYYVVQPSETTVICELCKILHEVNEKRIYENMSAWYNVKDCPIQTKLNAQIKSGGSYYVTKKTIL